MRSSPRLDRDAPPVVEDEARRFLCKMIDWCAYMDSGQSKQVNSAHNSKTNHKRK